MCDVATVVLIFVWMSVWESSQEQGSLVKSVYVVLK